MSTPDKYLQRGVSASKEDVHAAIKHLDMGLYPRAFCKVYPDYLVGDSACCNIMSADGSGTKSILAYLYWRETGDISVWRGISQDAIVMNLDDLLCVGATGPFLLTSIINRNKHYITGEVIAELIAGTKDFIDNMQTLGIDIRLMGGETADLGDIVRTVTVDAAMTARMQRERLILTDHIQAGDIVVGLCSDGQACYETTYNSGISSNGLTSARHDVLSKYYSENFPETFEPSLDPSVVYAGSKRLTDPLPNTPLNIGQALLSPTRTFAPVVKKLIETLPGQIHALINCTGGAHTKVLHYIEGLHIIKDALPKLPPLFQLIEQESGTHRKELYKVLNCGIRMEVYVRAEVADEVIAIAKSFNIHAQQIGYVEAAASAQVTVRDEMGEYVYR